jgi:hypothetical protein
VFLVYQLAVLLRFASIHHLQNSKKASLKERPAAPLSVNLQLFQDKC